jgi:hypothetical protein
MKDHLAGGRSGSPVTRGHNCSPSTISRWLPAVRADAGGHPSILITTLNEHAFRRLLGDGVTSGCARAHSRDRKARRRPSSSPQFVGADRVRALGDNIFYVNFLDVLATATRRPAPREPYRSAKRYGVVEPDAAAGR